MQKPKVFIVTFTPEEGAQVFKRGKDRGRVYAKHKEAGKKLRSTLISK